MRRALPWLVGALGGALVLAGVVVFALANSAGVGWTAYTASYAPLERAGDAGAVGLTFSEGAVLWVPQHALGAGLVVLGLLVLVGLAGWVFGRRSRRPEAGTG